MKREEFEAQQQAIPDDKLVEMAQNALSKLCETGGRSLIMTVPPRADDTDMIISELIRRFKDRRPLPPAKGAEQLIRVRNILQDFYRRGDYELEQAAEDIMRIFTQQPTAERAEEYVLFKAKRIDTGDWVTGFFTNKKIGNLICPVIEVYKEWDSGDYMESYEIDGKTLICLHAQKIADKMVEERLREELIKFDAWGYGSFTENKAIIDDVDEYLKSRER